LTDVRGTRHGARGAEQRAVCFRLGCYKSRTFGGTGTTNVKESPKREPFLYHLGHTLANFRSLRPSCPITPKLKSKLPEALSHPCEGGGDFMIRGLSRINSAVLLALGAISGTCNRGLAETMESALVKAYQNNPQLNGQRASARATDEAVPQALSGYRPRVSITG